MKKRELLLKTGSCLVDYKTPSVYEIINTLSFTETECNIILNSENLQKVSKDTFKKYYYDATKQEAILKYGFDTKKFSGYTATMNLAKLYLEDAIKYAECIFYKLYANNELYYIAKPKYKGLGKKYYNYLIVKVLTV